MLVYPGQVKYVDELLAWTTGKVVGADAAAAVGPAGGEMPFFLNKDPIFLLVLLLGAFR